MLYQGVVQIYGPNISPKIFLTSPLIPRLPGYLEITNEGENEWLNVDAGAARQVNA